MALSIPSTLTTGGQHQPLKAAPSTSRPVGMQSSGTHAIAGPRDIIDLSRSRSPASVDVEDTSVDAADALPQPLQRRSTLPRLTDAAMAESTAESAAMQVRAQPATAYLAQANLSADNVLQLLR